MTDRRIEQLAIPEELKGRSPLAPSPAVEDRTSHPVTIVPTATIPERHDDGRFVRKGEKPRNAMQVAMARRRRFQKSLRAALTDGDGVDQLAKSIAFLVKAGDPVAMKLAAEHLYGKPSQQVDVTTGGESLNERPPAVVMFGNIKVPF